MLHNIKYMFQHKYISQGCLKNAGHTFESISYPILSREKVQKRCKLPNKSVPTVGQYTNNTLINVVKNLPEQHCMNSCSPIQGTTVKYFF